MTEPVIKWCGSKRSLLPELLARLPPHWNRYYEPFAGGAALFFRLAPERAVVADLNADLVTMYSALASDPATVVRGLRRHALRHSPTHFYATRDRWNAHRSRWSRARVGAGFIYLNKTCFNGLWRVNRAGQFNVPLGRYEAPAICEPDRLHRAHVALAQAELRVGDFKNTVRDASADDLVYFDPPYDPVSPTANFTTFTSSPFGRDQQRELAEIARQLVARGCHVLLSNADTPFIRGLYTGFRIDRVKCPRAINSDTTKRGDVNELLIVGVRNR